MKIRISLQIGLMLKVGGKLRIRLGMGVKLRIKIGIHLQIRLMIMISIGDLKFLSIFYFYFSRQFIMSYEVKNY